MDGEDLWHCPRRPFLDSPEWFNWLFTSYQWMKRGFLPDGGTWLDQGAKLVELLQVIDVAIHDANETKRKQEEQKVAKAKMTTSSQPPMRRR